MQIAEHQQRSQRVTTFVASTLQAFVTAASCELSTHTRQSSGCVLNRFCAHAVRIYQRLRVIASYEPGAGFSGPMAGVFGGLCNQIYTHVGMLAVALHSGCEVVRAT